MTSSQPHHFSEMEALRPREVEWLYKVSQLMTAPIVQAALTLHLVSSSATCLLEREKARSSVAVQVLPCKVGLKTSSLLCRPSSESIGGAHCLEDGCPSLIHAKVFYGSVQIDSDLPRENGSVAQWGRIFLHSACCTSALHTELCWGLPFPCFLSLPHF